MPLHRTGARERILLMGGPGAGKTRAYHSLAQWFRRTSSPGRLFILDTDKSFVRMVEGFGGVEAYTNSVVYPPIQWVDDAPLQPEMLWPEYLTGMRESKQYGTVHDVLCVDMVSWPWPAVQDWYTNQVFGKTKAQYFLEARKAMGNDSKGGLPAFKTAYGADWQVINAEYAESVNVILNFPGHVIACASMSAVDRKNDDATTLNVFGRYGFKPEGQKNTAHLFHSVIALEQGAYSGWTMTTVKDREREQMAKVPVNDFVVDYLVKRGGWTFN